MFSRLPSLLIKQLRWTWICLFFAVIPVHAQEINLKGAIDFHVHSSPDGTPRSIDADDLAKLAKESGMRGLVLKNHHESTAALAYMVRKEVPGIEIFGGITMDLSNGGINIEAVRQMLLMKGGWGRVVWMPTNDAENSVKKAHLTGPYITVAKDGHLLPNVLELIDFIAQHHQLVLETGHLSAEEGLMVIHEAHQRGVTHIVVTHANNPTVDMSIPQMRQAASEGAFLELDAIGAVVVPPLRSIEDYANVIRQVGAKYCSLATDFGSLQKPPLPMHPQGLLDFMNALHKQGISVADIDLMAKTNPALALGLAP
jgi:hypothetical protein